MNSPFRYFDSRKYMYRPQINYISLSLALAEREGGSFMSKCRIVSLAKTLEGNSKKRRE